MTDSEVVEQFMNDDTLEDAGGSTGDSVRETLDVAGVFAMVRSKIAQVSEAARLILHNLHPVRVRSGGGLELDAGGLLYLIK